MRKILTCGMLVGLMVAVTGVANAQRPFQGMAMGGPMLLMNKAVQEELKITDDQREKLGEKMRGMVGKYTEVFAKAKGDPTEMEKLLKVVQVAAQKELGDVLKEEQVKRLRQIERQQSVPTTLTSDEEAIKDLSITDEQKERMKSISDESAKDAADLYKQFSKDNYQEVMEKVNAARKEANEKAVKALSDGQQAKWKEMIGDPFDVKLASPMGIPGFLKKAKK